MNGFARRSVLTKRQYATRKLPISLPSVIIEFEMQYEKVYISKPKYTVATMIDGTNRFSKHVGQKGPTFRLILVWKEFCSVYHTRQNQFSSAARRSIFCVYKPGNTWVLLRAGHRVNVLAERIILTAWFDHVEEPLSHKNVLPSYENQLPSYWKSEQRIEIFEKWTLPCYTFVDIWQQSLAAVCCCAHQELPR